MTGQRIGYIRVSSADQNPERQLEGIKLDRAFTDKASAKDTNRPELNTLLSFIREGDTLVVHSMDRLARNLFDLRQLVMTLTSREIRIEFVKEGLTFSGEDSPMAILMLSVMGSFAEFERALLKERQKEGIALAKKRGAYRGRKKTLSEDQIDKIKTRIEEVLTEVGMTDIEHKYPFELSGGEQQRVAVARALINKPAVIFADEPSGNLDTASAENLHQLFFKLRDEFGQTFVIVTHNEELANMADRKLVMVDGLISN